LKNKIRRSETAATVAKMYHYLRDRSLYTVPVSPLILAQLSQLKGCAASKWLVFSKAFFKVGTTFATLAKPSVKAPAP